MCFPQRGYISRIHLHVARAHQADHKFQIYRPVSANRYLLVEESDAIVSPDLGCHMFVLAKPLHFEAGDFVGWYHRGQGTTSYDDGGNGVRWRYGRQDVGSEVDFTGGGARTYSYRLFGRMDPGIWKDRFRVFVDSLLETLTVAFVGACDIGNTVQIRRHPDGAQDIQFVSRT